MEGQVGNGKSIKGSIYVNGKLYIMHGVDFPMKDR